MRGEQFSDRKKSTALINYDNILQQTQALDLITNKSEEVL